MNTDPIADLLTRIRNAVKAKQLKTVAPHSKLKTSILDVMKAEKFISGYKVVKNGDFDEISISLNPERTQLSLKRVSKPGQRIYIKNTDIRKVLNGYGHSILSTPKGVMTGFSARKSKIGGEHICDIW